MKFSVVKITFDKACTDVVLEGLKRGGRFKITNKRTHTILIVYNYV